MYAAGRGGWGELGSRVPIREGRGGAHHRAVGDARRDDGGRRDRGGPVPSDPAGTRATGTTADAEPTAAAESRSSPSEPDGDELRALPETYALALRLRAEGLTDEAIARVLDIEAESVGPLLALALSKLAGLEQRRRDGGGPGADTAGT